MIEKELGEGENMLVRVESLLIYQNTVKL